VYAVNVVHNGKSWKIPREIPKIRDFAKVIHKQGVDNHNYPQKCYSRALCGSLISGAEGAGTGWANDD
jgi:hypothetical protein